jgi:dTDP-4-dehydrorhamnose 3,5-epimerase
MIEAVSPRCSAARSSPAPSATSSASCRVNCSASRRGVIRGIHYSDVSPGQAKYVTCVSGAVLDVVVDLRVGSPGFGEWETVRLDEQDRRAVSLAESLGHAFMALS